MKQWIIRLLAPLGVAVAVTAVVAANVVGAPPAKALGEISMCTVAGGSWISVYSPPFTLALGGNGACTGAGTNYYPYADPESFYVAPGWCANYRVQNGSVLGPIYGIQAPRNGSGIWHSTYPGDNYFGPGWRTYVYAWTGAGCPV